MFVGEGLYVIQCGCCIYFGGGVFKVEVGLFGFVGEQIVGFWLWEVWLLDEVVEWVSCVLFGEGGMLELCFLIFVEDFGEVFIFELQQQEQCLCVQLEG